jgi:hypothetical protein
LRLTKFLDNWHIKVASLSAIDTSCLYPQRRRSLVPISVRGCVDPRAIMQPEGLSQWTISLTTLGTEQATFRLVEQCVNQQRYHTPPAQIEVKFKVIKRKKTIL